MNKIQKLTRRLNHITCFHLCQFVGQLVCQQDWTKTTEQISTELGCRMCLSPEAAWINIDTEVAVIYEGAESDADPSPWFIKNVLFDIGLGLIELKGTAGLWQLGGTQSTECHSWILAAVGRRLRLIIHARYFMGKSPKKSLSAEMTWLTKRKRRFQGKNIFQFVTSLSWITVFYSSAPIQCSAMVSLSHTPVTSVWRLSCDRTFDILCDVGAHVWSR